MNSYNLLKRAALFFFCVLFVPTVNASAESLAFDVSDPANKRLLLSNITNDIELVLTSEPFENHKIHSLADDGSINRTWYIPGFILANYVDLAIEANPTKEITVRGSQLREQLGATLNDQNKHTFTLSAGYEQFADAYRVHIINPELLTFDMSNTLPNTEQNDRLSFTVATDGGSLDQSQLTIGKDVTTLQNQSGDFTFMNFYHVNFYGSRIDEVVFEDSPTDDTVWFNRMNTRTSSGIRMEYDKQGALFSRSAWVGIEAKSVRFSRIDRDDTDVIRGNFSFTHETIPARAQLVETKNLTHQTWSYEFSFDNPSGSRDTIRFSDFASVHIDVFNHGQIRPENLVQATNSQLRLR